MSLNLVLAAVLLSTSIMAVYLSFKTYRIREAPGAFCFTMLMIVLSIWMFFQGIELLPFSTQVRIWFSKLSYIGVVYTGPFVFSFSYSFTNKIRWNETDFLGWLFLLPTAILGLVLTNEQHHLIWTSIEESPVIPRLIYHHGPGVAVLAIYSYILIIAGIVMFLVDTFNQKSIFRKRLLWLLFAGSVPLIASMAYLFNWTPIHSIDYSAIALTVTCTICAVTVFHYRLFDVQPIPCQVIFDHLTEGLIGLDIQDRLILLNPTVKNWFRLSDQDIGQNIFSLLPFLKKNWLSDYQEVFEFSQEMAQDDKRFFELTSHQLNTKPGTKRKSGTLLQIKDITMNKRQENELKISQKRFDQVAELAHEIFFEIEKDGTIAYISPYIRDILGFEPEMLLSVKKLTELIHPRDTNDEKTLKTLIDKYKSRSSINDFHIVLRTKDHSILHFLLNGLPIFENGVFTGYRGSLFDITEIKQLEKMKNDFITTVSHELRTPLTAIKGSIHIVSEVLTGKIQQTQQETLDTLEIGKRNILRLSRIITNVLDFQKQNNGRTSFNPQYIDPLPIIRDAYETMKLHANEKSLEMNWKVEEPLPFLFIDPDLFMQVLINLLHNAIKFTDKGSVSLKVMNEIQQIHIIVSDTGIGIQQDDMKKLFISFSQICSDRNQSASGSGLGLSISKQIIEWHEGRIWAESTFNQGSHFHILLPIKNKQDRINQ